MKHFKYLSYVLRHKWFVFVECCKVGIIWRGMMHDLSKFLPSEWIPYTRYFYGSYPDWSKMASGEKEHYFGLTKEGIERDFDFAWLLHQKRNKHHWQWWLLQNDNPSKEFTLQEPGQGYEMYLCRHNRHLAMFDESVLFSEDKVCVPNVCNDNAYLYAKEIRDRLNREPKVLPMPDKYRKEMLCDWHGAGRAINGKNDTKGFYLKNKDNIILHPETREWIEYQLGVEQ